MNIRFLLFLAAFFVPAWAAAQCVPCGGGSGGGGGVEPSAELSVVTTFESAGLYLDYPEGDCDPNCPTATVQYRATGATEWNDANDMDYDPYSRDGLTVEGQFRSSIVNLDPDTEYEVSITVSGDPAVGFGGTFRTWSETFPVGQTTNATGETTVTTSGTAEGYHLVDGTGVTVNGGSRCVRVQANFVIVRGFTCTNQDGQAGGVIQVDEGFDDVVIEHNEISGWNDGGGPNNQTKGNAIYVEPLNNDSEENTSNERIVVQYNYVHDPAWDTAIHQDNYQSSNGPRCVSWRQMTGGNHVIRHNTCVATAGNQFGDAFGGGKNRSMLGFPGDDSDIYGNYMRYCADDCIEAEGGNMNVRIWNNYADFFGVAYGVATVWKGPVYAFRNVSGAAVGIGTSGGAGFFKVGGNKVCLDCNRDWQGRVYMYHNTAALITAGTYNANVKQGNHFGGDQRAQEHWNNAYFSFRSNVIDDDGSCPTREDQKSVFDHDIVKNGWAFACLTGQEQNGIQTGDNFSAIFDTFTHPYTNGDPAFFTYASGTYGHDQGKVIPNFNDDFTGDAPDMGIMEHDQPAMCFGHNC